MSVYRANQEPAGPGSGGGGSPFGGADQMQMLMKYLPLILKVAKQAPGVIVGFLLTFIYMMAWVGKASFRDSIAPIGGFHIFVFFLARELLPLLQTGQQRAAVLRQRKDAQKSFHSDIAMQYREKLD